MKKPSIALCMIVRDVAPFIQRCLGSVLSYVDELCIVDTGSVDDTLVVIEDLVKMRSEERKFDYRVKHFTPETNPESFLLDAPQSFIGIPNPPPKDSHTGKMLLADYAKARQMSFDMAEADFIFWIDSDDIVENARKLPSIVEEMAREKLDTAVLNYNYEQDDQGRVVCQLMRARVTKNPKQGGPASWSHPIHENLSPFGEVKVFDDVSITHMARWIEHQQVHRPPLRNYKILVHHFRQCQAAKVEVHPRIYFYLGNESRPFAPDMALQHFAKYIERSDWDEEKSLALYYCGQIAEAAGDSHNAAAHFAAASVTFPAKPEPHFGLARLAFWAKDWHECVRHHERGRVAMSKALDVLHFNPLERQYFPALAASTAYLETGEYKKAIRISEEGLKSNPRDLQLLGARDYASRLITRKTRKLDIIFHTAGSFEAWGPETPYKTGIGGSETAAVHMSRALAERGHRVRIFCECIGFEGTHNNVEYLHWSKFHGLEPSDVFISSRRYATFLEHGISARLKILWMHDNHAGPANPQTCEGLMHPDLIMTVSNWHRQYVLDCYPFLNPSRVIATRNGIDTSLFDPTNEIDWSKKKNKLIYTSSADRGLDLALDLFPKVRMGVPDAELHVFYGFDTMEKMIAGGVFRKPGAAETMAAQISATKEKAEATQGVFLRGRVGQRQLAQEMMEAKALFYPTHFEESGCISAMEAQASGCLPITTALAALNETVHHGFMFKPPVSSPEYQEAFVKRAIWCLTNSNSAARIAHTARQNAIPYHSWAGVAEEWEDLFCTQLAK